MIKRWFHVKFQFFFIFAEEDDDDDDIDDEDDQPSTKRQKVEDEANDWFHEKTHTSIRKIENNKFALSQTCFSPKIVLNVPPTFLKKDTKMKCLKES